MKELILNSFKFRRVWWFWKNWFWTISTLGGCGGLERTDLEQFLLWEGVVVWCSGLVVLKGTDFEQFLLYEGVVVFRELILNSFYFGRVWWSWKNWFLTVSSLGGCGGLEITDFEQFLLWEGVVVLKELILNSFYFGRVWWSWKKWFWTVSYFGRMWWSWNNWFWTVSTLGGCGGLERTDFEQFLFWEGVVVWCSGVVGLKELILNSFYCGRVWWSWKNWFWTVSNLGRVWWFWKNWFWTSFYFGRVWWSWKNWFRTVSTLGGCGGMV